MKTDREKQRKAGSATLTDSLKTPLTFLWGKLDFSVMVLKF